MVAVAGGALTMVGSGTNAHYESAGGPACGGIELNKEEELNLTLTLTLFGGGELSKEEEEKLKKEIEALNKSMEDERALFEVLNRCLSS